jgi:hypothetical protein
MLDSTIPACRMNLADLRRRPLCGPLGIQPR